MSGYNEPDKISGHAAAVQETARGHWREFAVGTPVSVMNGESVLFVGKVVGSHECAGVCRVIHVRSTQGLHRVDAARVRLRKVK